MNFIFVNLKFAIPKVHPAKMDSFLSHIDSLLMGATPSLRIETIAHPVLTEFFSLCYILFFPYLLFSQFYYFLGELDLLKKFVIGLFTIYGLGFLGYSLCRRPGPATPWRRSIPCLSLAAGLPGGTRRWWRKAATGWTCFRVSTARCPVSCCSLTGGTGPGGTGFTCCPVLGCGSPRFTCGIITL